ncbi:MAG: chromate transporter [Oscillospiraceae bacterium]|nr:chromate transporter [Oscillospiraceae bacterium]
MSVYASLFAEFFRTGLFAVGGGMATLPFLQDMVGRYDWFTQTELTDMIAVAESTPGPIGVNMATYAGYHAGGVLGSFTATFALVLPSFLIMLVISGMLQRFHENRFVGAVLHVLRPASVGLVASAVLSVLSAILINFEAVSSQDWGSIVSIPSLLLFGILLFVCLKKKGIHPLVVVSIGAVIGIIFSL